MDERTQSPSTPPAMSAKGNKAPTLPDRAKVTMEPIPDESVWSSVIWRALEEMHR